MKQLLLISLLAILAACDTGGGGGSTPGDTVVDTTEPTTDVVVVDPVIDPIVEPDPVIDPIVEPDPVVDLTVEGVFLDSAVQGLRYVTLTTTGVTGPGGTFRFVPGETVTFLLGNAVIGEATGVDIITPMDLQGVGVQSDWFALNVLRLLQTIDTDGDASNGIVLPNPIVELVDTALDFNLSFDAFAASATTRAYVTNNANADLNIDTLYSTKYAATHFGETVRNVVSNYKLQLAGTTWTSVITVPGVCGSYVGQGGFTYTFDETGYTVVGTDSFYFATSIFDRCTWEAPITERIEYGMNPGWADFPLDCGTNCGYNRVNNIFAGRDADNRDVVQTSWHTQNTDNVVYTKHVLDDPNMSGTYRFKEVITRN